MFYNFIRTSDKSTISALQKQGFKMIQKDGTVATFLNDHSLTFDDTNKKIQYTNMLTF